MYDTCHVKDPHCRSVLRDIFKGGVCASEGCQRQIKAGKIHCCVICCHASNDVVVEHDSGCAAKNVQRELLIAGQIVQYRLDKGKRNEDAYPDQVKHHKTEVHSQVTGGSSSSQVRPPDDEGKTARNKIVVNTPITPSVTPVVPVVSGRFLEPESPIVVQQPPPEPPIVVQQPPITEQQSPSTFTGSVYHYGKMVDQTGKAHFVRTPSWTACTASLAMSSSTSVKSATVSAPSFWIICSTRGMSKNWVALVFVPNKVQPPHTHELGAKMERLRFASLLSGARHLIA